MNFSQYLWNTVQGVFINIAILVKLECKVIHGFSESCDMEIFPLSLLFAGFYFNFYQCHSLSGMYLCFIKFSGTCSPGNLFFFTVIFLFG